MLQNSNYDKTLKPLIPTTRSCNSLLRKIKYNLIFDNVKSEFGESTKMKENNPSLPNLPSIQNINDTLTVNKSSENLESNSLQFKENVSTHDQKSIEKTNNLNLFKNKVVEENKVNENVLKTVFINGETFSANVKQQSTEDEFQINNKKFKLSEKHVGKQKNEDLIKYDTSSSNNINKIDCCDESTVLNTGCSYIITKGSKRIQPTPFNENETSKRVCKTKSRQEKNILNNNQNQNIDFDCQNFNHENIYCATSSTDNNLILDHLKNSQDIIGMSCLEPPAKENKWVTKSSSSEASALNLKCSQNNFLDRDKDENLEICMSKDIELNNDQEDIASPSSDIQWPLKLSPCDPDSPESKPLINNSDQMGIETTSSDTEGNNSPKTENVLSLRNTDEIMSKLVSSRHSINENENNQIYALPMDQKPTHVEHSYVENAINSSTRDLEVVNVLSPVSINSTDIPMNKSSWVPDLSLAHVHNDHNDVDGDHSQSSLQQLNGLCNSISINTSRVTNHTSEVEHLNHMQLETSIISRPCSYNRIESRIFPDDSYTASMSPNENSVSNPAYGSGSSAYDVNRIPLSGPVKSNSIAVSPKDVIHELNSSSSMYHGNTINLSFNGMNNKSTKEPQTCNFGMNKTRPTDMSISSVERISPSSKDKNDVLDVVSDEFSDVDSMDLRINSAELKESNQCLHNLSMSSLISTDLKSINTLCNFEKSSNWSTIKNPSDTSNLHQNQKLKIYTDPTELLSGPVNSNAQSINLNEAYLQKTFLGNKSPSQVYYRPSLDFYFPTEMDIHGNIEDTKQNVFKNRSNTRDCVNACSNEQFIQNVCSGEQFIHSVLKSVDNDPSVKPALLSGYDNVLNSNQQMLNNGLLYKFPRSDINASIRYENSLQVPPHTNPDCLSPHNGSTYNRFDQILVPNLLEDPNQNEEQNVINMAHLMLQPSKNCKVHYKWPLNKNKSQTSVLNGKVQETSQNLDYKLNSNVLYKYSDEELGQSLLQNRDLKEISNQNSGLSFSERRNDSTSYQSNQQFQDISNLIASDLSPIQSGPESIDDKKQIQSQAVNDFESNSQTEPSNNQEITYIHRNAKIPHDKMIAKSKESRKLEIFNETTKYLFNNGELFVCMYPKCTNNHHFRVIPSNAEMLRHEFTAPYDDLRFNIQYKYKRLLTTSPRTWPNIPDLIQLDQRCLCEICDDFDSKLKQNQDMLHTYVEGKKCVDDDNNENEQPKQSTKPQIRLSWKKNLAHRFTSEVVEKQSIPQIIEEIKRYIKHFTHAFAAVFDLNKDVKNNSLNLQNACESYSNTNNCEKSFNSECKQKLDFERKRFNKDIRLHSYQYSTTKVLPKYVLEELSNSSCQLTNQNVLNSSHQFDEEHLPNEINRYFRKNSPSPSYQSTNSNSTSQSLNYIQENVPNTSHQPVVENSPSTSRQSSIGNSTNSTHQPILNNFPTTSHGISLDSCSLNDRAQKHSHMSRYYTDGQMYSEFSHTYLQVPSAQFANSSIGSYYGSPVNMPSDNSVPFCSPSLSINSVPNSPSSDCSIPSLVETVATAVPEHALLDDSLEAVNAAHNLMLISNRHRYNSTTSITTTNTTDTITVTTTATTNALTITNNFKSDIKTINIPTSDTSNNVICKTDSITDTVQSSITEPEDQETDIVHNSRRKKKKKHDKKKDKKKKGKR